MGCQGSTPRICPCSVSKVAVLCSQRQLEKACHFGTAWRRFDTKGSLKHVKKLGVLKQAKSLISWSVFVWRIFWWIVSFNSVCFFGNVATYWEILILQCSTFGGFCWSKNKEPSPASVVDMTNRLLWQHLISSWIKLSSEAAWSWWFACATQIHDV